MYNTKVSVIIPVYNAEKYLKECLDSVINQTLKEIEIICVNDCSTDSSLKILEEYAKKDDRIKIFNTQKSSGGPATGRNIGIENASGEYIGFIDNDDYIDKNFYEELYRTAKKYNTDVVYSLNKSLIIDGNIKNKEIKNRKIEGLTGIKLKEYIDVVVWNKIYKRDTIIKKNIKFFPYTEGYDDGTDDNHFYYIMLLNNLTYSYNNRARYYHRIFDFSLSKNKKSIAGLYYRIMNIIDNFDQDENINIRMFSEIYNKFIEYAEDKKFEYNYLYNIAKKIIITKNTGNYNIYNNYIIVKLNEKYENYCMFSKAIYYYYNKLEWLVKKIAWWIPIKKYRDKFRINIMNNIIPDQTRPDQTRPDQTRPDQYVKNTHHFIIIQKLKNYNLCNSFYIAA